MGSTAMESRSCWKIPHGTNAVNLKSLCAMWASGVFSGVTEESLYSAQTCQCGVGQGRKPCLGQTLQQLFVSMKHAFLLLSPQHSDTSQKTEPCLWVQKGMAEPCLGSAFSPWICGGFQLPTFLSRLSASSLCHRDKMFGICLFIP